MSTLTIYGDQARDTALWMRWADADYVAARVLLRAGLLVQGASFATTAIEKYLKTYFSMVGHQIPNSHKVQFLFQTIQRETATDLALNNDFLRLLEKAYTLRYPDDLPEGSI